MLFLIILYARACIPSGSVYVFFTTNGGATYSETQKLVASDGANLDYFGRSVSAHGNVVAVGAYNDYVTGVYSGIVVVILKCVSDSFCCLLSFIFCYI